MFPTFPSSSTRKSTWRARSTSMCVPRSRARGGAATDRALSSARVSRPVALACWIFWNAISAWREASSQTPSTGPVQ